MTNVDAVLAADSIPAVLRDTFVVYTSHGLPCQGCGRCILPWLASWRALTTYATAWRSSSIFIGSKLQAEDILRHRFNLELPVPVWLATVGVLLGSVAASLL